MTARLPRRHSRRILLIRLILCGVILPTALAAGLAIDWRARKVALLQAPPPHPPVLPPVAPASPAMRPALLLFGDSRVRGWAPLPHRDYPIIVSGHPGESAIRLAPLFARELARQRPAAAMIQLGINDAVAASLVPPGRRRQALGDTLAALALMARDAQATGTRLSIQLIIPPDRPGIIRRLATGQRVDSFVRAVNAAIPAIARRYDAQVVDPMACLAVNGAVPARYRQDSLHLTAPAYERMNQLIPDRLD